MVAAYTKNLVLPSCLVVDERELRLARLTWRLPTRLLNTM